MRTPPSSGGSRPRRRDARGRAPQRHLTLVVERASRETWRTTSWCVPRGTDCDVEIETGDGDRVAAHPRAGRQSGSRACAASSRRRAGCRGRRAARWRDQGRARRARCSCSCSRGRSAARRAAPARGCRARPSRRYSARCVSARPRRGRGPDGRRHRAGRRGIRPAGDDPRRRAGRGRARARGDREEPREARGEGRRRPGRGARAHRAGRTNSCRRTC